MINVNEISPLKMSNGNDCSLTFRIETKYNEIDFKRRINNKYNIKTYRARNFLD